MKGREGGTDEVPWCAVIGRRHSNAERMKRCAMLREGNKIHIDA